MGLGVGQQVPQQGWGLVFSKCLASFTKRQSEWNGPMDSRKWNSMFKAWSQPTVCVRGSELLSLLALGRYTTVCSTEWKTTSGTAASILCWWVDALTLSHSMVFLGKPPSLTIFLTINASFSHSALSDCSWGTGENCKLL